VLVLLLMLLLMLLLLLLDLLLLTLQLVLLLMILQPLALLPLWLLLLRFLLFLLLQLRSDQRCQQLCRGCCNSRNTERSPQLRELPGQRRTPCHVHQASYHTPPPPLHVEVQGCKQQRYVHVARHAYSPLQSYGPLSAPRSQRGVVKGPSPGRSANADNWLVSSCKALLRERRKPSSDLSDLCQMPGSPTGGS